MPDKWRIVKQRNRFQDIKDEYNNNPADTIATIGVLVEDIGTKLERDREAFKAHKDEDDIRHGELVTKLGDHMDDRRAHPNGNNGKKKGALSLLESTTLVRTLAGILTLLFMALGVSVVGV